MRQDSNAKNECKKECRPRVGVPTQGRYLAVAWLLSPNGVRGSLIFSSVHICSGLSALTAVGALSLPPQPQLPSPPHTPSPPRCGNQRGATRPQSRREAITLSFLSLRCLTHYHLLSNFCCNSHTCSRRQSYTRCRRGEDRAPRPSSRRRWSEPQVCEACGLPGQGPLGSEPLPYSWA